MSRNAFVAEDLDLIRRQICDSRLRLPDLLRRSVWRPAADMLLDWCVVVCATLALHLLGWWIAPLCLLVVGNRQRALGNLLHDAGHRNLSSDAWLNDALAMLFIAPALLADLATYRKLHARHHNMLGDEGGDPDFIRPPGADTAWLRSYLGLLVAPAAWWLTVAGHLAQRMPAAHIAYLLLWWAAAVAVWWRLGGAELAACFVALWFLARATVFHAITTFRELCDHFGLRPGGIFSFTRDISTSSALRWLFHPRSNGYHLTHHLMPAIPYYRLPRAHALFLGCPAFRERACVCDGYFGGRHAVVGHYETGWAA